MQPQEIDAVISKTLSIPAALRALSNALDYPHRVVLFYGYAIHPHSILRNDVIAAISHLNSLMQLHLRLGGAATDPFAKDNVDMIEPIDVDVDTFIQEAVERRDPRTLLYKAMRRAGIRTVWMCPLIGPSVTGYGVLNLFHLARYSETEFPTARLLAMSHQVHDSFKRRGFFARHLKITADEVEALRMAAQGKSAHDIAEKLGVTPRTVENRLQRSRKKLKAANGTEAVFKANAYGVI